MVAKMDATETENANKLAYLAQYSLLAGFVWSCNFLQNHVILYWLFKNLIILGLPNDFNEVRENHRILVLFGF